MLSHSAAKGLLPLKLHNGTISSADGQVTVLRRLGRGVSAASDLPACLSALQQQDSPPAWAVSASHGIFLDLNSSSPSSGAVLDVGEVCGVSYLAAARIKLCWMAPYHSSSIDNLPGHIQFLLVELLKGGPYAIMLPLLPNHCKATLQPSSRQSPSGNGLSVHLDSGNPDCARSSWEAAVYVAAGHDPFYLCDVAVAAAAHVAGGARPRWDKQLPEIASYLGWCTWDAYYHTVSALGVAAGLQGFKRAEVQPRWIIIDDGWQRTGLDSTAAALEQQLQQPGSSSSSTTSNGSGASQQPLQRVRRVARLMAKRVLRTVFGWLHWRCCWPLLLAALQHPWSAGLTSRLLQAYNRATSEHSKRLLSIHQFNAKFSDPATASADTSTASRSAQVLAFVNQIKEQYGIKHVYAWHATLGYWSGVSPVAAAVDAAAAAAAAAGGAAEQPRGSQQQSATGAKAAATAASAEVLLPRATAIMSDLEPPTNWSQLVLAGIGTPGNPKQFYSYLHSRLAALGITGVKVDVQNQLELVGSAVGQQGGQVLAEAWHAALEDSVAAHFPGNALINCMCHNTSDLYRMRDSCLARVSDDFYPRLPASHTLHVAVCSYNSLFFGPVVQPDWDMFHSLHPRSTLHATARMISGGPVYVSDKPGRHDPSLLARLALPGGRLLQPLLPGRACRDSLFVDVCGDGCSGLKVWNMNACGGVLALFNVQGSNWSRSRFNFVTHNHKPPAVTVTARPCDVWDLDSCMQLAAGAGQQPQQPTAMGAGGSGVREGSSAQAGIELSAGLSCTGRYALYTDSSGELSVVLDSDTGLTLQLKAAESDVVTVSPVLQLAASSTGSSASSSSSVGVTFAVIGLINMLNPGGALRSIRAGQVQQPSRSSDGSNNGSNNGSSTTNDSGSWVMASATTTATAGPAGTSPVAAAAGNDSSGVPAAASPDAVGGSEVSAVVQFVGCGQLLLYTQDEPERVLLDGVVVSYSFEASWGRLEVVVPIDAEHNLQHELKVVWS